MILDELKAESSQDVMMNHFVDVPFLLQRIFIFRLIMFACVTLLNKHFLLKGYAHMYGWIPSEHFRLLGAYGRGWGGIEVVTHP